MYHFLKERVWDFRQDTTGSKYAISDFHAIVGTNDQAPKDVDYIKRFAATWILMISGKSHSSNLNVF